MASFGTGFRFGTFGPQPITVQTISISGLPQDVKLRELHKLLKEKSGFIDLELDLEGKEPICFAIFSTQRDATKAIKELQNMAFDPMSSTLLRVEFGKNNPFLETGGSEGKKTFIRGEGIHGYFFSEPSYKSCLYLSKEDYLETCFVPYKTNEEALKVYKLLVAQHNEGIIICCYTPLQHKDNWFLPIERAKLLLLYFTERISMWKSIRPNILPKDARSSWFKDIEKEMKLFFGTTARIWAEFMSHSSETSIYTNSPDTGIWVTARNQIKVLPVLRETPNQIDIKHLSIFMKKIISLPFGANDYYSRKKDYRLNAEISSFLECLSSHYWKHVGSKFILRGHPFSWIKLDKSRFMVNLDEMIKRKEINGDILFHCCSTAEKNHFRTNWAKELKKDMLLTKTIEMSTSFGIRLYTIIRISGNLYRHCNDGKIKQGFDKIDVENKLSTAMPMLYVALFEALLEYAEIETVSKDLLQKVLR